MLQNNDLTNILSVTPDSCCVPFRPLQIALECGSPFHKIRTCMHILAHCTVRSNHVCSASTTPFFYVCVTGCFQQCPWEIGSVWAEMVGQGEVVGIPKGWKTPLLDMAVSLISLNMATSLILSVNGPLEQSSYLVGPPCSVQGIS